jgi:hypothetical protein
MTFPKVISIKVPNYRKLCLAWSAIIPMTSDGSWVTIWYSQDVHHTFQIKYGETLLFCLDVVHCGGCPGVDLKTGANYYRLHFYLQTEFQMAPDNEVNKFHIDEPHHSLHCIPKLLNKRKNTVILLRKKQNDNKDKCENIL